MGAPIETSDEQLRLVSNATRHEGSCGLWGALFGPEAEGTVKARKVVTSSGCRQRRPWSV